MKTELTMKQRLDLSVAANAFPRMTVEQKEQMILELASQVFLLQNAMARDFGIRNGFIVE